MTAGAQRIGHGKGGNHRDGGAHKYSRHHIDIISLIVRMLGHRPVDGTGYWHTQGHQGPRQGASRHLCRKHGIDADAGHHNCNPSTGFDAVAYENTRNQRGEQRTSRQRHQRIADAHHGQGQHIGREHDAPAHA